jgi:hypothetical protein
VSRLAVTAAPIFVVGPPRSGTNLTGRVLGAHPNVFAPAERSFFADIHRRLKMGSDWQRHYVALLEEHWIERNPDVQHRALARSVMDDGALRGRLLETDDPAAFFDTFMSAQARRSGKGRWCSHAHDDLFQLPTILDLYPDARIIVCLRHPLDCLVSYRGKWQRALRRNRPDEARRLRMLYHPVVTSLFWLANVRAIDRALSRWPGSVLLIRYEDLVSHPEAVARRLCAFIGEDFDAAMLNPGFNNSSLETEAGEIFTSSVGRWKDSLPTGQAYVCQLICHRAIGRFGYATSALRLPPLAVLWYFLTAPLFALRAPAKKRRALLTGAARRIGLLLANRLLQKPL